MANPGIIGFEMTVTLSSWIPPSSATRIRSRRSPSPPSVRNNPSSAASHDVITSFPIEAKTPLETKKSTSESFVAYCRLYDLLYTHTHTHTRKL